MKYEADILDVAMSKAEIDTGTAREDIIEKKRTTVTYIILVSSILLLILPAVYSRVDRKK